MARRAHISTVPRSSRRSPPFRTHYYVGLGDNEKVPYSTLPAPTLNFSPSVERNRKISEAGVTSHR
jgi:hypothetical protein